MPGDTTSTHVRLVKALRGLDSQTPDNGISYDTVGRK